jgi:hypothetical protein
MIKERKKQKISEIVEGYQLLTHELYKFVSIASQIENEVIPDWE